MKFSIRSVSEDQEELDEFEWELESGNTFILAKNDLLSDGPIDVTLTFQISGNEIIEIGYAEFPMTDDKELVA